MENNPPSTPETITDQSHKPSEKIDILSEITILEDASDAPKLLNVHLVSAEDFVKLLVSQKYKFVKRKRVKKATSSLKTVFCCVIDDNRSAYCIEK